MRLRRFPLLLAVCLAADSWAQWPAPLSSFTGLDHVIHSANGDVVLKGIPMVDQGGKDYCVVTSVERVMRYYGLAVDEDELARIAHSEAAGGTSTTEMAAALNRLTAHLGVKVRTLYAWDIREFLDIMGAYNHAARRARQPLVPLGGSTVDMETCMGVLQPALYKSVRMKKTADYGHFQQEVQRSIDKGIPLLWRVQLGVLPEPGLSSRMAGGHMRLIIGYNADTHEIIYSDSWGAGFEQERMPADNAWTITTGLQSLQPISS